MEILRESLNLCIPNVDSVEKNKHIEKPKNRENVEIKLPKKFLLGSSVDLKVSRTLKSIGNSLFADKRVVFGSHILIGRGGRGRHRVDDCRILVLKLFTKIQADETQNGATINISDSVATASN
jgi:hypothetical protein